MRMCEWPFELKVTQSLIRNCPIAFHGQQQRKAADDTRFHGFNHRIYFRILHVSSLALVSVVYEQKRVIKEVEWLDDQCK